MLSLDMGLLIAGAKERGELELRVTRLLQETRDAGDVILMCGFPGKPGSVVQGITRQVQEMRDAGDVVLKCGAFCYLWLKLYKLSSAASWSCDAPAAGDARPRRRHLRVRCL